VAERPAPEETVTASFGGFIQAVQPEQLTQTVLRRSKRMVLDSLGVGLLGSTTQVFELALQHCQHMYAPDDISSVYGRSQTRLSPTLAAFVNGVAVHSMDFDDTWHPATHPSGAVLPALLAISDMLPSNSKPRGLDFLLAFNVGIEVQGRLMRFSNEAHNIPKRFHPPSVVGTMGSAAACARLLALERTQCAHALAIAASLAGAPMANAATETKPLHIGNAARLGLEAALLASRGLEASPLVLDAVPGVAGFSAFYEDYAARPLPSPEFSACTALLDGEVTVRSFLPAARRRPELQALLARVRVEHPEDNPANFDRMYGEVRVTLAGGEELRGRCNTFYGHWRNPLSAEALHGKFRHNAGAVLPGEKVEALIETVEGLDRLGDCRPLLEQLH
ncbi:IRG1 decarboxylase, partial [Atractosteus spatula]|nr:IRG1 decarboxylase [Atractosteus spatula]